MTDTEKIEKIKKLVEDAAIMEKNTTPDKVFMMMKEYPLYDIAETVAELICFYNELREVVEG